MSLLDCFLLPLITVPRGILRSAGEVPGAFWVCDPDGPGSGLVPCRWSWGLWSGVVLFMDKHDPKAFPLTTGEIVVVTQPVRFKCMSQLFFQFLVTGFCVRDGDTEPL